jgi:hypothetical protein
MPGSDGDRLQVRFTDDGAGITPEHLPRIFERGFSTKSRESNSGIGLHWCANALNALGGSLRVENSGTAQVRVSSSSFHCVNPAPASRGPREDCTCHKATRHPSESVVDDDPDILVAYRQVLNDSVPSNDRVAIDQLRAKLFSSAKGTAP